MKKPYEHFFFHFLTRTKKSVVNQYSRNTFSSCCSLCCCCSLCWCWTSLLFVPFDKIFVGFFLIFLIIYCFKTFDICSFFPNLTKNSMSDDQYLQTSSHNHPPPPPPPPPTLPPPPPPTTQTLSYLSYVYKKSVQSHQSKPKHQHNQTTTPQTTTLEVPQEGEGEEREWERGWKWGWEWEWEKEEEKEKERV